VVRLLAERGVKVVVLDIQPLSYETTSNVYYFKCDLTSTANLAEVAKQIREKVGEPTILVNNAGVARGKSILDTSERDLKFTFDVNTFAHFYTVKEFLPAMVKNNHGTVVTVASFAAWMAVPNMVDYAASKAGSLAFHEGLAAELKTHYNAPKVRTVLVTQGHTKTPLFKGYDDGSPFVVPSLEPESVADAIVKQIFSGRSGHVTIPTFGNVMSTFRFLPFWFSYGMRQQGKKFMANWDGRQVVKDLETHYKKDKASDVEGSTVMVPKGE
jgi:all-trans-retinol dehydrogenase (NAD+)